MAKVVGVGGVFFKSPDPKKLYAWYQKHLGVNVGMGPGVSFPMKDQNPEHFVVWSIFPADTDYFAPGAKEFMVNLIVDDLAGAIRQVVEGGAEQIGEIESYEYGTFGWFMDPDGNKVELWQPPAA